jgi:hypothetical protein
MPSSRKRKIRAKYLKGLSKSDQAKQKAAIRKSRKDAKSGKYATRPKLKSFKSKKSPHVVKALKKFDLDSMKNLRKISRKTGCSTSSMKTILRKGKGAYYSDGSRPNQNADSWAYARLASAITGGGASKVDYKQLVEGKCGTKVMKVAKKPKNFKKTESKKSPKKSKKTESKKSPKKSKKKAAKKSPRKKSRAPQKFKIAGTEKPWLSVKKVKQHEKEAVELKIPLTFLKIYEKHPTPKKLMAVKSKKDKNWRLRRNKYVMEQLRKYNQHPTPKRWLQLVMWGYKPPGRRPKKSSKRAKYVRKTSRGVARTFKMNKKLQTQTRRKKTRPFQGHVKRTRGGTPIFIQSKNLPTYNPNWSDVSVESILKSRLSPFQKYLLLGVWAAANYSPGTKIPDIIQGDGGYLRASDQTPGIIPMGAPSSYATYSPGLLLKSISDQTPKPTRQVVRAQKKREKKSPKQRVRRKISPRKKLLNKHVKKK